jgi:shikimate kinase
VTQEAGGSPPGTQRDASGPAARPASLFLVGMMGAGKTTVGRLIAKAIGFEFVDCDREIESRSGVAVATIFELEGEAGFRRREAALIDELTLRPRIVLATGGGAVLREDNRERLHARGLVVYLQASADEIARRTANDRARPLLQAADPRGRIAELLQQREPLYRATAHLTFASPAANPRRLVRRILDEPRVQALTRGD